MAHTTHEYKYKIRTRILQTPISNRWLLSDFTNPNWIFKVSKLESQIEHRPYPTKIRFSNPKLNIVPPRRIQKPLFKDLTIKSKLNPAQDWDSIIELFAHHWYYSLTAGKEFPNWPKI